MENVAGEVEIHPGSAQACTESQLVVLQRDSPSLLVDVEESGNISKSLGMLLELAVIIYSVLLVDFVADDGDHPSSGDSQGPDHVTNLGGKTGKWLELADLD